MATFIRDRLRRSPRLRVVRLAFRLCPGPATGMLAWAVVNAVTPVAMMTAMARTVGQLPVGPQAELGPDVLGPLLPTLAVTCTLLALTLVIGPLRETLNAMLTPKLTYALQARLMTAVSGPVGIAHLEDAAVLDRLELAQGSLATSAPAEAPNSLAQVLSTKLAGTLACGVVAVTFRWWIGVGIFAFWMVVRQPVRRLLVAETRSLTGQAHVLRRAMYFRQVAGGPRAAKEIRIFGLNGWSIARFRNHFVEGMSRIWRLQNRQAMVIVGVIVGMAVVYGGTLVLIADAIAAGELSLAQVALLIPMLAATTQVGVVDGSDVALEFALAGLPHLEELEAQIGTRTSLPAGDHDVPPLRHGIRFEGVGFTYPGQTTPVFDALDLILPAQRSTAVVGVNGAGKSTVVKLLARLHDPGHGRISVDGVDVTTFDPATWQRRVAVVFQDFTQYPVSAADNVGFGSFEHRHDQGALESAARRAGALTLIEELPRGWETVLSREFSAGADLSGGQWQRIALARALFALDHGADVLALDEPTSWLDARGEAEFFDRFLELTRGVTTLIISHRFSTVRRADHICVIDGGAVVEAGTHDELVAAGGHYATAFSLQADRFNGERAPA